MVCQNEVKSIETLAGTGANTFTGDNGPALQASLKEPFGVTIDSINNILYVCDAENYRVRKIVLSNGVITTIAGTGEYDFAGDNGPAVNAKFRKPVSVALNPVTQMLYVLDTFNVRVRAINLTSGIIATVVGNGTRTNVPFINPIDGVPATSSSIDPTDIAVDYSRNVLYIGDYGRVRAVNLSTNIITTVAGYGVIGNLGDGGPALSATFSVYGIALDVRKNILYFANQDQFNVRQINLTSGIISRVAGAGGSVSSGDGGLALSANLRPNTLAVDETKNLLYIAETFNFRMRVVNLTTSIIDSVVGTGIIGFSGDGYIAKNASVSHVRQFAIHESTGVIYFPDTSNHRIRKILSKCNLGYYRNNTCLPCVAGSYSSVLEATQCEQCAPGTFSTIVTSNSSNFCLPCNPGEYTNTSGSTSCWSCLAGSFSSTYGSASCTLCPKGTKSNVVGSSSSSTCQLCSLGSYSNTTGSTACLLCPLGTFASNLGSIVCTPCAIGTYSIGTGNIICIPCAAGSYASGLGSTNCTSCAPGTYSGGTGGGTVEVCASCPAGTISSSGATFCQQCPIGSYTNYTRSTSCSQCQPGNYSSIPGSTSCIACPIGAFSSVVGSSTCSLCPIGSYNDLPGASSCKLCQAGSFSSASGSSYCQLCGFGSFSSVLGATSCSQCPAGSYSNVHGASMCIACSNGTYASAAGSAFCSACPIGAYSSTEGASVCTPCLAGTYNDQTGSNACKQCSRGSFSSGSGSIACQQCPIGTYSATNGSTICTSCSIGTYNDRSGAAECKPCEKGTYNNIGSSATCIACPLGTFSSVSGASSCQVCPAGSFADITGSVHCSTCSAGYYQPTQGAANSTSCLSCPIGTYSHAFATSCTLCPQGTYSNRQASTSCTNCPSGTYSAQLGLSSIDGCLLCPVGTYSEVLAATSLMSCKFCENGTYSSVVGASSNTTCDNCPPGTYGIKGICVKCRKGTFSLISRATSETECTACAPGTYSNEEGSSSSSSCTKCPIGFFAEQQRSTNCIPCPFGMFSAQEGASMCIKCRENETCSLGSKNPIDNINLLTSQKSSGDPYFSNQKERSEDPVSDSIRLIFIIGAIVGVVVIIVLVILLLGIAKCQRKISWDTIRHYIAILDFFSLKHYVKPEKPIINHATWFGGVMTLLMLTLIVSITVISIVDIVRGENKIETASVVPKETLRTNIVNSTYKLVTHLVNYGDSNCNPTSYLITGFMGAHSLDSLLLDNYTCSITFVCTNCVLQGSSQMVKYFFAQTYAMAAAIDYQWSVPHFDSRFKTTQVSERIVPDNITHVFRGPKSTEISISMTTTLFAKLDPWDFFFYNILSKIFNSSSASDTLGYATVRNTPILGSTLAEASQFWNQVSLSVSFEFIANPNAYFIQQIGRSTVLDFFSKIFALIAASASLIVMNMNLLERIWKSIQQMRRTRKQQTNVQHMELTQQPVAHSTEL